jgi:hypothetical protein
MSYHRFFDSIANEVILNLNYVQAVTSYSHTKKRKDDNPMSATYLQEVTGETIHYIKYELGANLFKLQSFSDESERDKVFKKVKQMLAIKEVGK